MIPDILGENSIPKPYIPKLKMDNNCYNQDVWNCFQTFGTVTHYMNDFHTHY